MAAAVNCFDTEPASKIVSGVMRASCSRSAMPYAGLTRVLPATEAATAQPGLCVFQRLKISSTEDWLAAAKCEARRATVIAAIRVPQHFRLLMRVSRLQISG